MIRRLLVALDDSGHAEAGAILAIDWARRFGFALVGLGVLDEPTIQSPELAAAEERIGGFLRGFREGCEAADVPCAIVEDIGNPDEQIVLEAAGCDAVMLGTRTNSHFATPSVPDRTLERVLRLSPRPVIVVPRHPVGGEGVLVAYGGGQQIARALQTFTLLGLAGDEPVVVIAIDRDAGDASRRLGRAGEFLDTHAVGRELVSVVSDDPPAEVILEEARRRRPRMLVMGTPGYHPFRDLFSTSVTRAVLAATSTPVFVGS